MTGHPANGAASDTVIARRIQSRVAEARSLGATDTRLPELIHIDELSAEYADRPERWVEGSLRCLRIARKMRDASRCRDTVFALLHLRDGRKPRGPFFRSVRQLSRLMGYTPPEIGWTLADRRLRPPTDAQSSGVTLAGLADDSIRICLVETRLRENATTRYIRGLWFISPPPLLPRRKA